MYFNHWTDDLYDLSTDSYSSYTNVYGLSSLGCSTFKYSEIKECSKLLISMDSTNKIINSLP